MALVIVVVLLKRVYLGDLGIGFDVLGVTICFKSV